MRASPDWPGIVSASPRSPPFLRYRGDAAGRLCRAPRRGSESARIAKRVAGLGYAVPGSVIAVGVMLPFAWLDTAIDDFARAQFGVSTGLLLTGGLVALVFAYLRSAFSRFRLNAVDTALGKVTPSMDGAGRTLGAGPGRACYGRYTCRSSAPVC